MDPPYRHTIASGDESSMNVQGIQGFSIFYTLRASENRPPTHSGE